VSDAVRGAARALPREALDARSAGRSLATLGFAGLVEQCRQGAGAHAPDTLSARDPRGFPIAYSHERAGRPVGRADRCPVCDNETCAAVDVLDLPGGDAAWLTPNLYPILYPYEAPRSAAAPIPGVHLVQWSSLRHDGGLTGAGPATACAIVAQWARAEEFLLHHADARFPESAPGPDGLPHRGHCGLVKNRGRTVGGSVEHDHQQILLSAAAFAEPPLTHGLADALLREAAPARLVERLDDALVVVPGFMRRPLHAFIVPLAPGATPGGPPRAARAGWLHHLPTPARDALAVAIARLARAVSLDMQRRGLEPAWNMILHTGPGCAPLLELRPHTQPLGGFEQLGLWLSEERPETSAGRLREALG
jgi:hypothetical protein